MDSKGAVELVNDWNVCECTRPIMLINVCCELMEEGLLQIEHLQSEENVVDHLLDLYLRNMYKYNVDMMSMAKQEKEMTVRGECRVSKLGMMMICE